MVQQFWIAEANLKYSRSSVHNIWRNYSTKASQTNKARCCLKETHLKCPWSGVCNTGRTNWTWDKKELLLLLASRNQWKGWAGCITFTASIERYLRKQSYWYWHSAVRRKGRGLSKCDFDGYSLPVHYVIHGPIPVKFEGVIEKKLWRIVHFYHLRSGIRMGNVDF